MSTNPITFKTFLVGDRVQTPDGPGEVIGLATLEYIPLGRKQLEDDKIKYREGIQRTYLWGMPPLVVDGPYVVRLEHPIVVPDTVHEVRPAIRVRGYMFDQLQSDSRP